MKIFMIFPITIVVSFIVSTISYNSLTKFSRTNVLLKCNQQNNQSISNTLSSVKSASSSIFRESLSGFVVSLSTLPPSAAYASLIGLNPLIGIWSSFIVGSIVALLAGGPGVIAGAAGVIAIPIAKLVHEHGLAYMGAAIMLAGLIESLFGLLKLGKLSKYVTEPVIAGFLNSFSLFLIKAQMTVFMSKGVWLPLALFLPNFFITSICIFLIRLSPLLNTSIPPSLVGLSVSSAIAILLKLPIKNLADVSGPGVFTGGSKSLPSFTGFPNLPLDLITLRIVFPTAVAVAIISLLETILARRVACAATGACPPDPDDAQADRAAVAVGLGNFASAMFGGFGGCGLIPNTLLNSRNGGLSYVSSLAYALSLALCVILFAPVIGRIPMAALSGLMINVGLTTFEWKETVSIIKEGTKSVQGKLNLISLFVTSILCSRVDMGLGVLVGVLISQAQNITKRFNNKSKF